MTEAGATPRRFRTKDGSRQVWEITLEDYHPGEISHFEDWAEWWLVAEGRRVRRARDEGSELETPRGVLKLDLSGLDDEDWDLDREYEAPRWTIRGDRRSLDHLYHRLLSALAESAWDWYGMGGDDHCYDYWPNTMQMAAEFRDQLVRIGEIEAEEAEARGEAGGGLIAPYSTTYLADELRRVYWLVRESYVRGTPVDGAPPPLPLMAGTPAREEADAYFEEAILSAEPFGPREPWASR